MNKLFAFVLAIALTMVLQTPSEAGVLHKLKVIALCPFRIVKYSVIGGACGVGVGMFATMADWDEVYE